ncbi:uncharacterized protein I303_103781 [Kwoniella dejecticola CBS 10117]|uniref:Mei2-like C-terminal RNA recognition motif domain-containing protein n=1 Tax=Kwoniella dejecticola CBS 10117 TaxID=1296121 RepID=A0AAJ8MF83_9TREE
MTLPLTPTASGSSHSAHQATQGANLDKELPSTPKKTQTVTPKTPSPGKGKKHHTIEVRIPTPISSTLEAGKRSVLKSEQPSQQEERDDQDGKSSLNPQSSSFEPKAHPDTFVAKLQNLSIKDARRQSAHDYAASPSASHKEDARSQHNAVSTFETPRRMVQGKNYGVTPNLTYTPYTPSTSHSAGLPVTPVIPLHASPDQSDAREFPSKERQSAFSSGLPEEQSADDVGRYLLIQGIPQDTSESRIVDLIQSICSFKALIVKHNKTTGYVMVAFYDTREAIKLYETFRTSTVSFARGKPAIQLHCLKVDQSVLLAAIGHGTESAKITNDSEPVIKITITGGVGINRSNIHDTMLHFGPLKRLDAIGHEGRMFILEYFDTRDATKAIAALDGQTADKALISVSYVRQNNWLHPTATTGSSYTLGSASYAPGKLGPSRSSDFRHSGSTASSDVFGPTTSIDSASTPLHTPRTSAFGRVRSDGEVFMSRKPSSIYSSASQSRNTSGYSTPLSWDRGSGYEAPQHMLALGRRLHEPGTIQGLINNADIEARARQGQGLGGHYNPHDKKAIPAPNRVFPERILSGLDSRTTVMVKDVPNKLSREELVTILEEVVPGDYDFVYLRFDFKNCCNVSRRPYRRLLNEQVGYAFVNFCSVGALYKFIQEKVGRKWNMFSSEKVLQVSYADIQGKAALINKFKNSAVMGVIEPWRPQIFYTSGRMKGQPEPFPQSDNLAIRERSAAAQLAGYSNASSYSNGYDDQFYDYPAPLGSTYEI